MKSVVECDLRGTDIPCKVCGHIPPDFCGRDDSPVEAPQEPQDDSEDLEATDTPEDTEEAASEAPKGRKAPLGAAKKRSVAA